eukprot:286865-Chlamydomonas_euryale.AAC.1
MRACGIPSAAALVLAVRIGGVWSVTRGVARPFSDRNVNAEERPSRCSAHATPGGAEQDSAGARHAPLDGVAHGDDAPAASRAPLLPLPLAAAAA